MVYGLLAGTIISASGFIGCAVLLKGRIRLIMMLILGILTIVLAFFYFWMRSLYKAFDYNGEVKLAKRIIEKIAEEVKIPDGGVGLDVGCGSGALTIACAKNNPKARMVGCDIWGGSYTGEFSKKLCEDNAKAEGAANVSFEQGNAIKLPFEDESFDALTSNYVYHNISGHDKQKLLMESLRVLKKGGSFAIHDLMSPARYGDMDAFIKKLKAQGYEEVELIDTTDGTIMNHKKAAWLGLSGSMLLKGKK